MPRKCKKWTVMSTFSAIIYQHILRFLSTLADPRFSERRGAMEGRGSGGLPWRPKWIQGKAMVEADEFLHVKGDRNEIMIINI